MFAMLPHKITHYLMAGSVSDEETAKALTVNDAILLIKRCLQSHPSAEE